MPPRRSQSRERGPPCGPSQQDPYWNQPQQPLWREESSRRCLSPNKHPNGGSIPQQRLEGRASSMSANYSDATPPASGLQPSFVNIVKTRHPPQAVLALKGVMLPGSTANSSKNSGMLPEAVEVGLGPAQSPPQPQNPAEQQQCQRVSVRFSESATIPDCKVLLGLPKSSSPIDLFLKLYSLTTIN